MGYTIRTMTRDEVRLAVDWAATEGWNPGLHDAQTFASADPDGFFVGELDGQPVATMSMVKYGPAFAFLGLYIVHPEFRGRGLGWAIWQHGMACAAGRQVGLDGVVTQQDNYRKSGFRLAWRNLRYQGKGLPTQRTSACIGPLAALPFDTVQAYDAPFFPADRSTFLRTWITQPDAHAFGYVEHGQLHGYGVMRRCRVGWKIGPLVADREAVAEALYLALATHAGVDVPVYLDLPEPNAAAVDLMHHHGMKVVFETARMYTGEAPRLPVDRLYGVTTLELG